MADVTGRNIVLPIFNADGTAFHGLELRRPTYDSVVMSLGDKITGDVYYNDSSLQCAMQEYVEYDGVRFYLVNPPTIVREGMVSENSDLKGMTKYSFEFVHPMSMLANFPFTDIAVSYDELKYKSQDKEFAWIGYIADFVAKLNKNLQETEWVCELDETTVTEDKRTKLSEVLTFSNNTIADALKTAYETWDVPFVISSLDSSDERYAQGKKFLITFGLPSNDIYATEQARQADYPYIFRFGQGVGLKNNSATPKNNKIVTRIAGYGSDNNIPYGYPQIVWDDQEHQDWDYTIDNDPTAANSYPIYDGIVNGRPVKLIKHPFTRTHLMPSVYAETVNKKVNPVAEDYDPTTEIVDFYDAIDDETHSYPHNINPNAPSFEIHEFADIKPELGTEYITDAYPINNDLTPAEGWNSDIDDEGNYLQSYFKVELPQLDFDLYACASITEEMQINMRGGACIGCTFGVQVDWDDYKKNFFDSDGNFDPVIGEGHPRNGEKYPDSSQGAIELILQKDMNTFGTLMPNEYQYPQEGDQFVILGISLPLSYVMNAQERLDEAMQEYMLENNVYYFEYPLKFDEYFLANNTYILSQIKNNNVVRFEFQGQEIPLYIKQITIKYGDKPLPEYNITLTDDVEIVLNQIGQVTEDVSRMRLQVSALQSYFDKNLANEINNKLSRVHDDTARGKITFLHGFEVGNFVADSSGASLSIDDNNSATTLELDFLTVRRAAKFREITIQELKHIGGELALTAAAMECSAVEEVTDGYKCYFETTDGERTVYQEFVVGDQARCQQFTLNQVGDGYQSTKYYWRVVKEVGENYIVLSDLEGEVDGEGVPSAGDKIVQLGYRGEPTIPYRTTAIILSATANDAPSTKYYEGITSFSLDNVVKDEGYSEGVFHSNVYGSSYVGDTDHTSYVEYTPDGGMKVNAVLEVGSTLQDGTDVNNLMAANINLLINSGFTGDYQNIVVGNESTMDEDTEVYSPSFKHWEYNQGCLIQPSTDSASGYQCYMGSIGRLSQTIEDVKETSYVVSIKASGADVTVTFGGESKTFALTATMSYYSFKVINPTDGIFTISTSHGCVICEPMVAEGNVFDTWSRSPEDNDKALEGIYAYSYLMSALTQASTTINKGLLLTQLIKVGNYRDGLMVQETGGMSGLVNDENGGFTDPFVWGGGTMNQAMYTIMKYKDDPSYQATDEEISNMAKFVVTHGGRAILNDIVLRGYIYALGGKFTGEVNAESGVFKNVHSPNGNFSIDDEGNMYVQNRGRIGGYYISGSRLTNQSSATDYITDATIVFRNDTTNKFAGIGGDVGAAGSGIGGLVARFENENDTGIPTDNYAVYISAKDSSSKNIALLLGNGCIGGFRLNTVIVNRITTLSKDYNVVVVITGSITVTMPSLSNFDDGQVIYIKNLSGDTINISAPNKTFDNNSPNYALGANSAKTFIYCANLTVNNVRGTWITI